MMVNFGAFFWVAVGWLDQSHFRVRMTGNNSSPNNELIFATAGHSKALVRCKSAARRCWCGFMAGSVGCVYAP
ncbi:hypothetical protein EDC01DRAFT_87684 [Geopyxis carbonaria]|nr:hypothetical protein EDC01DRAFT_87684 [Geopyxis carbonaria]